MTDDPSPSPVPAPPEVHEPKRGVHFAGRETNAFDSSPLYKTEAEKAHAKAMYEQMMKERLVNKELKARQVRFKIAALSAIVIFLWAVLMTAFFAQERRNAQHIADELEATTEELATAQAAAGDGGGVSGNSAGRPPGETAKLGRRLQLLFSSDNKSGWQDANTKLDPPAEFSSNPYEEKVTPYGSLATGLASLAAAYGAASVHVNGGNIVSAGAPYFQASQDLRFGQFAKLPGMGDIELFNGMNLALTGMGKYDWSGGLEAVGAMVAASHFPWVSANLDLTPIRSMLATIEHPLTMETNGKECSSKAGSFVKSCYVSTNIGKVGFVGISPEDLFFMIPPSMGVDSNTTMMASPTTNTTTPTMPRQAVPISPEFFNTTVQEVQEQIALLEETSGVNIVVLMDHASISAQQVSAMVNALTGVDVVLATALEDMGGSAVSALPDPVQIFSALRSEDKILAMGGVNDNIVGYPIVITNSKAKENTGEGANPAGNAGSPIQNTALVFGPVGNNWRYIGNVMVEFDYDGNVLTWDGARTGPIATTRENVDSLAVMLGKDALDIPKVVPATLTTLQATPTVSTAFANINVTTEFPLIGDWTDVRTRNTNLGNLIADAYRWAGSNMSNSTSAALLSGGSIYDSIVGPEVVPYAVAQSLALNSQIVLVEMTAPQLIAALEHAVSALPVADGRFPHFSNHILVSANIRRPPLEGMEEVTKPSRIEFLIVTSPDGTSDVVVQAYTPVGDLNRNFTIATSSLLHDDRMGFKSIAAANVVVTEMTSFEQHTLEQYMTEELGGKLSMEDPPSVPRLTITNKA